jgi:copper homeostasis protein CutC
VNINLHIERLILDAVDVRPGQRDLLRATLETELARLLTEGGLASALRNGGAFARITTPAIPIHDGNGRADFGKQIAAAVYRGIGT